MEFEKKERLFEQQVWDSVYIILNLYEEVAVFSRIIVDAADNNNWSRHFSRVILARSSRGWERGSFGADSTLLPRHGCFLSLCVLRSSRAIGDAQFEPKWKYISYSLHSTAWTCGKYNSEKEIINKVEKRWTA